MAKIINFQEYVGARMKEKLYKKKIVLSPKEGIKTEEAYRETEKSGRRSPYIIVIY